MYIHIIYIYIHMGKMMVNPVTSGYHSAMSWSATASDEGDVLSLIELQGEQISVREPSQMKVSINWGIHKQGVPTMGVPPIA